MQSRSTINGYWVLQIGKQTQDHNVLAKQKDPRTTLQELKDMLLSDNPDVMSNFNI